MRAWLALPNFRGQAKFGTWLYRIVTNLCCNRRPHLRRELLAQGDDAAVRVPDESPETDPATGLEADEHRAFLHRQVEALPVAVGMAGCHPPNTIAISISNRAGCATSGVVGGWRWREVWRWRAERVYWRR